ncbi:kinase-like domain-containing protein [Roridomyces roridus]|uniref:Kinase-like domain-containing protein n=1 Tax=Roridomyces roridus TaxID=1738132 RepID=A0AAD7C643_9AGAR|nr:kinase-like domain-containing protein [Roridomyces roridus]
MPATSRATIIRGGRLALQFSLLFNVHPALSHPNRTQPHTISFSHRNMFSSNSFTMLSSSFSNGIRRVFVKQATLPKTVSTGDFDPLLELFQTQSFSVHLVRDRAYGRIYTMKSTPRNSPSAIAERNVLKTIALLPNAPRSLLPLVASWNDSKSAYIVTPWCAGKDMSSLLVDGKALTGMALSVERVKFYMAQLVAAVETLHDLKIVHRDIKPANVFLTAEGNVVLGDFGLANSYEGLDMFGDNEPDYVSFDVDPEASSGSFFQPIQDRCGTPSWMSPAQQAGTPYAFDTDLWAPGALMYRMSTGRMPYDGTKELIFTAKDGLDEAAQHLLRGLLVVDGAKRLTIGQMKCHGYFTGVNWDAVSRHEVAVPWVPPTPYIPTLARRTVRKASYFRHTDTKPGSFYYVAPSFHAPPPSLVKTVVKAVKSFFKAAPKPQPLIQKLPTPVKATSSGSDSSSVSTIGKKGFAFGCLRSLTRSRYQVVKGSMRRLSRSATSRLKSPVPPQARDFIATARPPM